MVMMRVNYNNTCWVQWNLWQIGPYRPMINAINSEREGASFAVEIKAQDRTLTGFPYILDHNTILITFTVISTISKYICPLIVSIVEWFLGNSISTVKRENDMSVLKILAFT